MENATREIRQVVPNTAAPGLTCWVKDDVPGYAKETWPVMAWGQVAYEPGEDDRWEPYTVWEPLIYDGISLEPVQPCMKARGLEPSQWQMVLDGEPLPEW